MTMPVTLALQAAALAFALVLTGPTSLQPTEGMPTPVIRTVAPAEAQRLHCRLYFGCAPARKVSVESVGDSHVR
jgi:hypothetical protein